VKVSTTISQVEITSIDRLRIRFWLSQIVLLIALLGILTEDINRSPILITLSLFMGVSLFFPPISGVIPRKWMPALAVALLVVVISDLAFHWRQPLDAILRAGYLILWTRTIFYRTSRESMQLLLLALFLIMLTGVFSVSISYIVQLLLFTPISMILLMLNTTRDPEARDCLEHADWKHFKPRELIQKIVNSLSWPLLGLVLSSTLFMIVSISAIFVILPRFNFSQMIPSLSLPGTSKSGFSENFKLGSVTSIIEDPAIAFRVEIPQFSSLPETPYWRMLALDVYENGSFSQTSRFARKLSIPTLFTSNHFLSNRMIRNPGQFSGEDWVYYLEGSISRYLPTLGSFRAIEFKSMQSIRIDPVQATFRVRQTSSQLISYRLRHVLPNQSFRPSPIDHLLEDQEFKVIEPISESAATELVYPESTLSTRLNKDDAAYLRKLVTDIKELAIDDAEIDKPYDPRQLFAIQVDTYLKANHRYSLSSNVQRGGNRSSDPVIAWLQSKSPGHCEYFAAATVLLLRANDIPARVVTGFVGGDWNAAKTVYTVRNFHAHAWCEYYDSTGNWNRLDTTPAGRWLLDLDGFADYNSKVFGGWLGWIETLKLNYYRTIVGFDDASQLELVSKLTQRMQQANFRFDRISRKFSNWFESQMEAQSDSGRNSVNFTPIIITGLLLLFIGAIAIFLLFHTRLGLKSPITSKLPPQKRNEQRHRSIAGKLLKKMKPDSQNPSDIALQLQTIRFGPCHLWREPETIFHMTRKHLREKRKQQ